MTVRAKFYVSQKTESPSYNVGSTDPITKVEMSPVYESFPDKSGNACEENAMFGDATPSGKIEMFIHNKRAADYYKTGASYYVDFIEAE